MALSLKPAHLKRYADIARLLVKYGQSDLVKHIGIEETLFEEDETERGTKGEPEALAHDLEAMGPTFIKLGQMLSTRPDLLPVPYVEALSRLQDKVGPFPYEDVERIVQEELSVRLSKAFDEFEATPIAAASLGQVHRARMRDGRAVAVKVQRPGIRQTILDDLAALGELTAFVDTHTAVGRQYAFGEILEQFKKSLLRELDYRQEAHNMVTLGDNLQEYDLVIVPRPVDDYTTSRVLTMDYIRGTKVTKLSPLARLEINGRALAESLAKCYLDQILVDGFFHADPHPGNVFITDDGRIALIDLGMVAHLDPQRQEELLKLLLAVSEGRGREAAEISIRLAKRLKEHDLETYTRAVSDLVAHYHSATVADIQVGRIVTEISLLSGQNGLRPPPELTMLGKTLLHLDEICRTLDPTYSPNDAVREHADTLLRRRMLKNLTPGNVLSSVLEMSEFVNKLPQRLNAFLDLLTSQQFKLNIDAFDEERLLNTLHRIANRLSLSVVLAALIVGAALLMQVRTTFTIFGYPGIAMVLFMTAAACGFFLVFSILFRDERKQPGSKL